MTSSISSLVFFLGQSGYTAVDGEPVVVDRLLLGQQVLHEPWL
jgi:hypothetical protein